MHVVQPIKLSIVTPLWNPINIFYYVLHHFAVSLINFIIFPIHIDIPFIYHSPNKLCFTSPTSWIAVFVIFLIKIEPATFICLKIINNYLWVLLGIFPRKFSEPIKIGRFLI